MEALNLVVILILIVVALRKKVPVGVTLFGAGLLTALLFWVPLGDLLQGYRQLVQSKRFLSLTAVIVLVTTLGQLLKELGYLDRLTRVCQQLPGGNRTAAASLPALIGLMPMPGGALLSAPLVDNVLDKRYPPEFRTATNYWFRHVVEFFWPVYPGIILTEAITGMPLGSVSLMQLPMAIVMALIGYVAFARRIHVGGRSGDSSALAGIGGNRPVRLADSSGNLSIRRLQD